MKRTMLFLAFVLSSLLFAHAVCAQATQQILLNVRVYEVDSDRLAAMTESAKTVEFLGLNGTRALSKTNGESCAAFLYSEEVVSKLEELHQTGAAKLIAEPTLVTVSGRPASFVSGGEVPIAFPTGHDSKSIEYRRFGTKMDVVLTQIEDGKIRIELCFEQNNLSDKETSGLPIIKSHNMNLRVEMRDAETLCIVQCCKSTGEKARPKQIVLVMTPELVAPLRPESNRIENLRAAAAKLRDAGMHDLALELARKAAAAQREHDLVQARQSHEISQPHDASPLQQIQHEVRQLSTDVAQLHRDVKRLIELIETPPTRSAARPTVFGFGQESKPQPMPSALPSPSPTWRPLVPYPSPRLSTPKSPEPNDSGALESRPRFDAPSDPLDRQVTFAQPNATINEVAEAIGRNAGVNVFLHDRGLKQVGLTSESTVRVPAGQSQAAKAALDKILEPLDLGYIFENEVLKITNKEATLPELTFKVYHVADLVLDEDSGRDNPDFESLIESIIAKTGKDSWEDHGGRGSIRTFRTSLSLVAMQTQSIHDQIRRHLVELRESKTELDRADSAFQSGIDFRSYFGPDR